MHMETVKVSRPILQKPGETLKHSMWVIRDCNNSRVQRVEKVPPHVRATMRDVKHAFFQAKFISQQVGWEISTIVVADPGW